MLLEAKRSQGRRMDQAVMPAGAALDQDEIAGGRVANPSGVERDRRRLRSCNVLTESRERQAGRFVNSVLRYYMRPMSSDLTDDDNQALIAHARQKFAKERYQLAPALRPVREVLAKLGPKPEPEAPPPRKPYMPSTVLRKKRR
jgi:hypothetical protein